MEAEFQDYERNRKWNEIFSNIYTMGERYSTRESSKPVNKPLNRYLDVVPYDKSRVTLERHNLNYINASHVSVPSANRNYILTQGPLQRTSGHFWLMIWEQKSKAILMLNNLVERGQVKCHQYWPDGEANGDENELIFEDVNIKVELSSTHKFDYYMLRKFKLTDLLSETSKEVLHFHYTHWPDFDLPKSSDSFLEFLYAVRESGCLNSKEYGPTVIHCSAGIGRSGTFVLVDSCLVMIEQNKCRDSINVIDVLLEMRKYRMGLIQTAGQLRFSFQTIIEGSKKILASSDAVADKKSTTNALNNNNNTTCKAAIMQRLNGVDEEAEKKRMSVNGEESDEEDFDEDNLDDDDEDDDEKEEENDGIILDERNEQPSTTGEPDTTTNESSELRKRKRDEKRQKTLETIQSIKRKQKEVEERLKLNDKLYKYLTPVACLGLAVGVGVYLYWSKRGSLLLNYE